MNYCKISLIKLFVFLLLFSHVFAGENIIEDDILLFRGPQQKDLMPWKIFQYSGFKITLKAEYRIKGRVLGIKSYLGDEKSAICNYDIALGWGVMSDPEILSNYDIYLDNRMYYIISEKSYIDKETIIANTSNNHLVFDDKGVLKTIQKAETGNIVEISGYLINIAKTGMIAHRPIMEWVWRSSMTRNDTGPNSCEIIWVEEFFIHD